MSDQLTTTPSPAGGGFDFASCCAAVAKSRLGGITTPEQAFTLASIALADDTEATDSPLAFVRALGKASRDFHIINGRPSLKADAMLARFQSAGGKVSWGEYSDVRCEGTFSHPAGGSITLDWSMERAKKAGIVKPGPWVAHPRAMLRARVISEAIRTIFPGVICGLYTPDEVTEITESPVRSHEVIITAPSQDVRAQANDLFGKVAAIDRAAAETMKKRAVGADQFIVDAQAWLDSRNAVACEAVANEETNDV